MRYEAVPQNLSLVELDDQNVGDKMRLLFELAYRYRISFYPLDDYLAKSIHLIYTSGGNEHLSQKERTSLCAFMFAEARRKWEWEGFEYWASQLRISTDPTALVELNYGNALRAKENFDLEALDEIVKNISGDDPIWKMRQGMLYSYLYEDSLAAQCFQAALLQIKERRAKDKQSIWLLSREAWAAWIFQSAWAELPENQGKYYKDFGEWPTHYTKRKCDPWDYMGFIDRKMAEIFEKLIDEKADKVPLFNAGHSRDTSGTVRFGNNAEVSAYELCVRLQETVGIPSRIGNTNVLSKRLERAVTPKKRTTKLDFFSAAGLVTDSEKRLMASAFNRVEVANIPLSSVIELTARLRGATDFLLSKVEGGNRRPRTMDRLRNNIEIISRLCVRMSPVEACDYLQWALQLCENNAANDFWLYKHIGNVMERCIEALPADYRKDMAYTALFLPLSGERGADAVAREWPELIDAFEQNDFFRPDSCIKWTGRIEELIRAVGSAGELDRDRAILRLRVLFKAGQLKPPEIESLAFQIWKKTDEETGWPCTKSLYPFVFLELPETVPGQALDLFISCCVEKAMIGPVDANLLNTVAGGVQVSRSIVDKSKVHFAGIFETCLGWQPRVPHANDLMSDAEYRNNNDQRAIAVLLTCNVLPELDAQEITAEAKELWTEYLNNPRNNYSVATAFEYSRIFTENREAMVLLIRKALHSTDETKVAYGFFAVNRFIEALKQDKSEVPPVLISTVISICESVRLRGLHHALSATVEFVKAGVVDGELVRLTETAAVIWSEFTYDSKTLDKESMITCTLVRGECVKLAKALIQAGQKTDSNTQICDQAAEDPIPEVRFA